MSRELSAIIYLVVGLIIVEFGICQGQFDTPNRQVRFMTFFLILLGWFPVALWLLLTGKWRSR